MAASPLRISGSIKRSWQEVTQVNGIMGPNHPELGIALDMTIQLKTASGQLCSLALSFNNEVDVSQVDVSMNGIELQGREFFSAITQSREPNASVPRVLDCYRVLDELERQF